MFEDRLFRGFVAGLAGGIAMNVYGIFSWLLNFTEIPFWEWASIMILGTANIDSVGKHAIGVLGHVIFTAILGIVFAYLLPNVSSRLYLFKGWLYGVGSWFFIYSINHIFKVEGTYPIDLQTAMSNAIGASIFGLAVAWTLAWLDKKKTMA